MTDTPVINIGANSWPVAPLTLGEMKKVMPLINATQAEIRTNGITEHFYDAMFDLLTLIIKRADPEFDRPKLEQLVAKQQEIMGAFITICGQAGMEQKPPGEATGE